MRCILLQVWPVLPEHSCTVKGFGQKVINRTKVYIRHIHLYTCTHTHTHTHAHIFTHTHAHTHAHTHVRAHNNMHRLAQNPHKFQVVLLMK